MDCSYGNDVPFSREPNQIKGSANPIKTRAISLLSYPKSYLSQAENHQNLVGATGFEPLQNLSENKQKKTDLVISIGMPLD